MANKTSGYIIDEAQITDAPRLAVLCTQLGYPASEENVIRRLEDLRGNEERVTYVARTHQGQVIGWIGAFIRYILTADKHVQLSGLVVDEAHRGRNVGEQLVEAVEGWAVEQGCETIYVRSNATRVRAHHFYIRLGYQQIKSSLTFEKSLSQRD